MGRSPPPRATIGHIAAAAASWGAPRMTCPRPRKLQGAAQGRRGASCAASRLLRCFQYSRARRGGPLVASGCDGSNAHTSRWIRPLSSPFIFKPVNNPDERTFSSPNHIFCPGRDSMGHLSIDPTRFFRDDNLTYKFPCQCRLVEIEPGYYYTKRHCGWCKLVEKVLWAWDRVRWAMITAIWH